ncbi:hypothetical protein BDY19DRAFT_1051835 [Irpex rosettiformis]|uniref:Uncharacterized protein n=1 Tax=Irpex rosettiformis TaxID=378272 RepID=A0ACB8TN48_9APHY|nr:hypothetical protein BDY19DRAFT_1051835 [Irpex rosettiformis]
MASIKLSFHYIIATITAVFLLASYTTTISFSSFAGMYKPASSTQTADGTLPLNARICTESRSQTSSSSSFRIKKEAATTEESWTSGVFGRALIRHPHSAAPNTHPKTTVEAADSTSVNHQHTSSPPAASSQQVVVASTASKAAHLENDLSLVTLFTFSLTPSTLLVPSTSSFPPRTSSLTPSTSSLPPPHPIPHLVQVPTNSNPNSKNRSLPDGWPFALAYLGIVLDLQLALMDPHNEFDYLSVSPSPAMSRVAQGSLEGEGIVFARTGLADLRKLNGSGGETRGKVGIWPQPSRREARWEIIPNPPPPRGDDRDEDDRDADDRDDCPHPVEQDEKHEDERRRASRGVSAF